MLRKWLTALALIAVSTASASAQQRKLAEEHSAHVHGAVAAATPASTEAASNGQYGCPMQCVPNQENPGKCSVCGMSLVKANEIIGPHGGQRQRVGSLELELLVEPDGLRLFASNLEGQTIDVRGARGVVTLKIEGNPKRYRYDLFPTIRQDKSAESLGASVDLSKIAGRKVELSFQLAGLASGERRPTEFVASVVIPSSEAQHIAAAIAEQKTCPVSGQPLGSMGEPVPVKVGERTIYVCCPGCINKVKANSEKYFAAKPKLTAAPATPVDAAAIARQKVCPVMEEPLGGMGTPLKVTGLERDVFLCCKGCLKMLERDPEKYLAMLLPAEEKK